MDRKEVIRKYEQKCYNYLKLRFEDVYWKSLNRPLTKYDFVCYNNNLVFTVDAKKVINNNIVITKNQFNCSLFIIEIDNNIIIANLRYLFLIINPKNNINKLNKIVKYIEFICGIKSIR